MDTIIDVLEGPFGKDGWEQFAQQLKKTKQIILYHGTTSIFLNNILRHGLQPRNITGNSVYETHMVDGKCKESLPNQVYLIHRSKIGFGGYKAVHKWGGELIGLRILISDMTRLLPDEDSHKKNWYQSIAWEDSCAHQGAIPPEQILGIVKPKKNRQLEYIQLATEPDRIQELMYGHY